VSVARKLFFDLPVPKKLVAILWIFLIVVIALLGLSYLTIENLSAARAYVGGEGLWSKAQKQAVRELLLYSTSRSESHFAAYQRALLVPLGDRQARLELEKPHPDMNLVRTGLVQGRNNPEDVTGMAALFRHCRKMSHMSEALEIWAQGDALIDRLQGLGSELHHEISSDRPNATRIADLAHRVDVVGDQLTPLEDSFSYALGAGARQAKHLFLLATFIAAAISFAGGLLFTLFMLRHMRQTDQRHRQLLDAANDVILVIDAETGVVAEANARSGQILGRSSGEMIGRNAETIVSECDREAYRRMVQATGAGQPVAGRELHLDRADGSALAVEVNAVMTEFAGRKLILGIFRDIRERKRLEEETRQAQKMEVVGRLVGGIAHDFNNLLMVILTQLRKIRVSPSPPLVLEHAETARIAAERAASLTSQLLSFGRRQVLVLQVLDLNELLEEVKEMLSTIPRDQVQLTMTLSVESLPVKVDPGKIEQVIMNLVVNACDAIPSGGDVVIRTARVPRPAPETGGFEDAIAFAMLEVTDTGYGMEAETKAHLFEPFFTTKPLGKGTGLGLSTAYGIVKQSGGSIEVESSPGRGSTFRVYLPMVEKTVGPRTIREWPASSLRGSETILLAEDQPAIRSVLREFLEAHGYKVLEAQNGNEAREIAKTYAGAIDVLVADVIMPHIRGTQLAKLLTELRPEICVVLISGYSEDALLDSHLLAEGNMTVMQKPFEPEELVQKIREVLPGSRMPPGPRRS
jgi:two-component system cell cycle sensor histidine kinase/response regulator CckA